MVSRAMSATRTPLLVAQIVVRASGLFQILLGLVLWTGHAHRYVALHIASGILLVLALWGIAAMALRAGMSPPVAVVALVWGAVLPLLGLTQDQILQGSGHWIVQVLHLIVGLAALGLAERLGRGLRSAA